MEVCFFLNLRWQILRSRGKSKQILQAILKKGIYLEEGYWTEEKIKFYNNELNRIYIDKSQDSYRAELNSYLGSERFYYIDRDLESIKGDFKDDPLILEVAEKFNGVMPPNRKVMFQYSIHNEETRDYFLSDMQEQGQLTPIAPRFHFDFMRRTVKAVLYLNDVRSENGATEFCIQGSLVDKFKILISKLQKRENYVRNYFLNKNKDFDSIWTHTEANKLNLPRLSQPLEGKAGTLAIFDTYMLHRANFITEGERRILWYYFNF